MSKRLLLTLIICTLCACNPTPQATPPVTEIDPEEYALLSAMIEQNVVGFAPEAPLVVICDQTKPGLDTLEMALERPTKLPKQLVEAYRLRNAQPYTLDPNFSLERAYELMPQSEYDSLIHSDDTTWADFEAAYPQAEGIFLVSRVGLNAARDEALVSVSYYCGALCLEGGMFWMVKEDDVWKVKLELVAWMS